MHLGIKTRGEKYVFRNKGGKIETKGDQLS